MNKSIDELIKMNKRASELFEQSVEKMIKLQSNPNTTDAELLLQYDRIKTIRDDMIVFTGCILDKCNDF